MGHRQGRPMSETRKLTLVCSPAARRDLIRLREFIQPHNPRAAQHASETIQKTARLISENPAIGSRIEGREDREFFTPFGQRGYVLRYQIIDQIIIILKVWHARENREV